MSVRCTYCRTVSESSKDGRCSYCGAAVEIQNAPAPDQAAHLKMLEMLPIKQRLLAIRAMNTENLTELVTMPGGKRYSYWRDGTFMTAGQRVLLGSAVRELVRRSR